MKIKAILMIIFLVVFPLIGTGSETLPNPLPLPEKESLPLDLILSEVENRYLTTGFSARFVQISTIKVMDISDTATGNIYVKPPGKMRWEYESPDPQLIVSDGKNLWVHRPEDNQVMQGESPSFFGDGKGAGFLSDIKQIREKFDITLLKAEDQSLYLLKLIPQANSLELSLIYLFISKENYNLVRIVTYNVYEDETRVDLSNIIFNPDMDDRLFTFAIPEGTDLFQIDQ
jgi:outer membrane lipoprotein carrier protein